MSARHAKFSRGREVYYLTAVTLLAALLLGGGTRTGFLGDVILQYLALVLILVSAAGVAHSGDAPARRALYFCAAIMALPLLQLIPLPPGVRGHLPGKDWISGAYELFGKAQPYWPLSLAPHATWTAFLALLPPMAVFLGSLLLSNRERSKISTLVLGFCGLSVFLGLLQLAQGPASTLRLFAYTNVDDAVGFFANRNHFSALLYCGSVLSAWWIISELGQRPEIFSKKALATRATFSIAAAFTLFAILVMAQAMARSRGGLVLSMVALVAVLPLALAYKPADQGAPRSAKMIYAVTAFAVVLSLQFALYRILARFEADPMQDARVAIARNTFDAAKAYLPFGAGAGSFVWVYPAFERPSDVATAFANRAHNDVVEAALEAGLPALVLMALFLFWFLRRAVHAWRPVSDADSAADQTLIKAATVIIALLSLHSFVDYPLRTSAMASLAAFACALLVPARRHAHHHHHHETDHVDETRVSSSGPQSPVSPRPQSRSSHPRPAEAIPSAVGRPDQPGQARPAARPGQKWEAPAEWPEEWKSAPGAAVVQPAKKPGGGSGQKT